jgi:DNA-binding winged helix-turn-helix (wHTH) protein
VKAADIVLDRDGRTVTVAGEFVDLTPSEFDILASLMASPGRVYSRLDLLDIIQGVRYEGYERTIDTHIKNLRGKIESDSREPVYIETVYGVRLSFQEGMIHAFDQYEINPGIPQHWHRERHDHLYDGALEHAPGIHTVSNRPESE